MAVAGDRKFSSPFAEEQNPKIIAIRISFISAVTEKSFLRSVTLEVLRKMLFKS